MPHSIEDEAIATEAVDMGTLLAENASLRDRLLRALAEDHAEVDAQTLCCLIFAPELLL